VAVFFRGTFENRLDKKGRVSVPADFRARLKGQAFDGIVAFPSLRHGSRHRALECSGTDRLDQMSASIDPTQVMPGGTSATVQMLLGQARDLAFDGEGRIVLPEAFIAHLGSPERVTFVGQGPYFEIWEAGAFAERAAAMLQQGLAEADRLLAGGGR
jgi:MraZ protein